MIRITLIALAMLAAVSPAAAQAGAPVRMLGPSATAEGSTVWIAERKDAPCADKNCVSKPIKRGYVGAAPLGW
jgi:hypothetical protein